MPATIDLENAEAWVRGVDKQTRSAVILGLQSAALRGVQTIVAEIIPSRSPRPFDRGIYQMGWRAKSRDDGADIENLEPHAVFIEYGVRAGNVKIGKRMIDALTEWVNRKGIGEKGKGASVAWAIAKSMQKRGIFGPKGMGILKEYVDKHLKRQVDEEIARELAKVK